MTTSLDWIEQEALEDAFAAATEKFGLELRAERRGALLSLCVPGRDCVVLNRVIGLSTAAPPSRPELEEILAAYRRDRVDRFFVHLYENDCPPSLRSCLENAGVVRYRRAWDKLVRGRDEPLPRVETDLVIRRARADDAPHVGAILGPQFDLPVEGSRVFEAVVGRRGWHTYLAWDGETPVAAGLAFISGEVAYMAGAATLPGHRGRGAQLGLLVERVRVALSHGCHTLVVETGEPFPGDPQHSHRNIERAGFRVVATRANFAPNGTLWRHGTTV
jgi:hypothetical protein